MPKWRTPKGTQLRHCAKVALAALVAYALTLGGRNDAGPRALLAGLLSELQQICAVLVAIRNRDSRAATR